MQKFIFSTSIYLPTCDVNVATDDVAVLSSEEPQLPQLPQPDCKGRVSK